MTRNVLFGAALLALAGCASDMSVLGSKGETVGSGEVRLSWVEPHEMVVEIGGQRYVGPWSTVHCAADTCGEMYESATRAHRRHIRKGHATLTARDGSRLECDWISHLPQVDGTCSTRDGQVFKITGQGPD